MPMAVRPSLRLLISGVCAAIVLIVAAITLAITLTTSTATIRDIGQDYAVALATTAQLQTQNYLTTHDTIFRTVGDSFVQDDAGLSIDEPNKQLYADKLWRLVYSAAVGFSFNNSVFGIILDDWSGVVLGTVGLNTTLGPHSITAQVLTYDGPNGDGGQKFDYAADVRTSRMIPGFSRDPIKNLSSDPRVEGFQSIAALAAGNAATISAGIGAYPNSEHNIRINLSLLRPILNSTGGFLGLLGVGIVVDDMARFVTDLKGTDNTHVFLFDGRGYIVASSHPTNFITMTNYVRGTEPTLLQTGCFSSDPSAQTVYPSLYILCRSSAAGFAAFPPLQKISGNSDLMHPSELSVQRLTADDGKAYFAVTAPVNNNMRLLELTVALFIPEDDVLGGIRHARNIAIGVTAAVFVIATAVAFGLVYALLQPLTAVSRQMLSTARLRDSVGITKEEYSSIAEIQDLQKAYTNMNTAIQSFTRYVPRDVVKDLMASGQLCTIQMTPQQCTMLFVDIAGFTTICERVPPDVLSDLVSQYFDRASRIVMEHDGLIDKYIGDSIMAVWGAPFAVSNQEVKATLAAKLLDRETAVQPLSSVWDEAGEVLRVRVGVSTGEVLAGNMGSADRMNYTVIGDPVNLAARLESLNKQFGTRVMVSEMTAERLAGVFVLRLLMPIAVVGKEKPAKAYEVLGALPQLAPEAAEALQEADSGHVRTVGDAASDAGSDLMSVVSRASSNTHATANANGDGESNSAPMQPRLGARGGAQRHRVSTRTCVEMLREAQRKTAATEVPVTCSDPEVAFAAAHTAAVHRYIAGDFPGALAATSALRATTPAWILGSADAMTPPTKDLVAPPPPPPPADSINSINNTADNEDDPSVPLPRPSSQLLTASQRQHQRPYLRTCTAAKSVEVLEGLCRFYLEHGKPANFDGVYRALDK